MEKRMEEVNGSFQIQSEPNKGTQTIFLLPKNK
jgi:signal transduction histidine kinase